MNEKIKRKAHVKQSFSLDFLERGTFTEYPYTARHTWATTAYYCEIHPGIISEAMGHSSITVTETYLKPFRNKKIDEANRQVVEFVKRTISGLIA